MFRPAPTDLYEAAFEQGAALIRGGALEPVLNPLTIRSPRERGALVLMAEGRPIRCLAVAVVEDEPRKFLAAGCQQVAGSGRETGRMIAESAEQVRPLIPQADGIVSFKFLWSREDNGASIEIEMQVIG